MSQRFWYRTMVPAACLMLSVTPVWAIHAVDDFDDRARDERMWPGVYAEGNAGVSEDNDAGRLEFTSTGNAGYEQMAHYSLGLNIPYAATWTAIVYLSLTRGRDLQGAAFLTWAAFNEYDTPGGEVDEEWPQPAATDSGSLKLVWNEEGSQVFKAYFREVGQTGWTSLTEDLEVDDWTGLTPESYFTVAVGGFDEGTGQALGDGSKMYLDDFSIDITPEGTPGDANLDGNVNDDDLSLLLANWGAGDEWREGDFNLNRNVNDDDLSLLLANWTGAGGQAPEPAGLALLMLAVPAVLRRIRT